MTKLVLLVNKPPPDFDLKFSQKLKGEGCGWWHWFPGSWLITDPRDRNALQWRDEVSPMLTGGQFLVFDMASQAWGAMGQPEWFDWIQKEWYRS